MAELLKSPAAEGNDGNVNSHAIPDDVQTPNEQKLAEVVLSKYKEAKRYRASFDKDWDRWYRLYAGQHWDGPRPEWRSDATVNFIFSTIETILPIMTDQSPQINVVAASDHSMKNADIIGECVKRVWVDNDMDLALPEIIKNTLKYGTGIVKVWWDPSAKDHAGDVAISNVDPRHFFPSPGAKSLKDAHYIVFAANIPVSNVQRDFPDLAEKITPGVWDEELTVNKTITSQRGSDGPQMGPVMNTAGTGSTEFNKNPDGRDGFMSRDKLCTFIELWSRDSSGQTWCTMMANGVLLKHWKNPFHHNKFPFVRFIDYPIPSNFWGMGEIQQLEKLQMSINQRRAQTYDILRLTANPPFVADADSGINPKAMTNRPATIIYKNRGSEVSWLTPPQLPSALFTLQELDKQDFDSISGVHDVTQGRRPVGIEAASAITELQEAAQTRIRQKVRQMEGGLRNVGRLIVALIQQFYDDKRVIRIVGQFGTKPQFITMNQESVGPDGTPFKVNDPSIGEYEIEIGVGSTMPVNRTRRAEQMIELFQLGIVDKRAVLENAGLPPEQYEKILARMEQAEAQILAAETGQPPQGGQAPGGAPSAMPPAVGGEAGPTEEEIAALEAEAGA